MKKFWLATASVAAVLICGCRHTHVDQVPASDGRQDWYKDIKANYPGFRPPRLISPGISGYTGPAAKTAAPAPAEKFSAMDNGIEAVPVDPETDVKPEVKPAVTVDEVAPEAPKAEVKAPEKAEVAPEAPKTDEKAEVKPEAKPEVKPEVKPEAKAETKKIEPPDPTGSDIYEVKYGDTLGAISKKFYGSTRHTNLIQKANSDIITNANVLKPGMKLIIPKL